MTMSGGTPDPTSPWWLDWDLNYFPDAYAPIYGGHSVQQALYNTLQKWLPAYINVINRKLGGDILQQVKTYSRPMNYRPKASVTDVQIDVIVPGLATSPQHTRSNKTGIQSTWLAELSVFVYAGTDWQETMALCYAYGAAARTAIVQHPDLLGFATTTNWTGEAYFKGEPYNTRWLGIASVHFEVVVSPTVDMFGGPPAPEFAAEGTPTEPSLFPIPDFPDVTGVNATVENQSLSSEEPTPG